MEILAKRLKKLREEKDVSQKEVAENLGITTPSYGFYERDEREPGLKKLLSLADYYSVSIDYLLGKTNDRETTTQLTEDILGKNVSIKFLKKLIYNEELTKLMKMIGDLDEKKIKKVREVIKLILEF